MTNPLLEKEVEALEERLDNAIQYECSAGRDGEDLYPLTNNRMEKFIITDEHLKLAQRMYVGWENCEYGAPAIDCKRPYGNSSVEEDICEILGKEKISANYEDEYRTEDLKYAADLHQEMQRALQIFLCTLSFETGTYEKQDEYGSRSWKKL